MTLYSSVSETVRAVISMKQTGQAMMAAKNVEGPFVKPVFFVLCCCKHMMVQHVGLHESWPMPSVHMRGLF